MSLLSPVKTFCNLRGKLDLAAAQRAARLRRRSRLSNAAEPGALFRKNQLDLVRACRARLRCSGPRHQRVRCQWFLCPQLRRAAVAPLWRLPARLRQPGGADRGAVHAGGAARRARLRSARADRGQAARQYHRCIALSAARAGEGSQGQAAHRARRNRTCRCADPVREALRLGGGPRSRPRAGWRRSPRGLSRQAWSWRRRRAHFRFSTRANSCSGRSQARCRPPLRDAIGKHGIRNGVLTSIAPTGTISLFAGNVSSGIEPVFDFEYRRRILAAGRHAAITKPSRITRCACSANCTATRAAPGRISSTAHELSPAAASPHAGRAAEATSTRRSRRP